jgi:hypothetical protein
MNVFDPYSTARPLIKGYPTWLGDPQEQARIASYLLYEQIYWTIPEAFKLVSRGKEDKPIYIPSGKVICETLNRYLAPKMKVVVDPTLGDTNQQALATQVMSDFMKREKLASKFAMNKRYGIIRGDWIFYLQADPNRPPGAKISIFAIDPASFFYIYNEDNIDEIIGVHVVNQYDVEGKPMIKRETWRKTTGTAGPSPITYESAVFKVDEWGGPGIAEKAPQKVLQAPVALPSPIDQLPFYHIPHFSEPGLLWGSSEMRGLERLMASINQAISDEDLALALEGLGVYATTAGTPVDADTGEDTGWNLGPGRVVELPETEGGTSVQDLFARINGVGSVTPFQEHLAYMHDQLNQAAGQPAIARGAVSDVQIAESGIALRLELAPLLTAAEEKDQIIIDVTTNMMYDLAKWFIAYEGTAFNSLLEVTRWNMVFGDKVPEDKQNKFNNLMTIAGLASPIVPKTWIRGELVKLGWEIDEATVAAQLETETQAAADAFNARVNQELNNVAAGAGDGAGPGAGSGSPAGAGAGSNGNGAAAGG